MSNCIKCGAALPWAGKSCAFCGTPVSESENIEAIAVAAADTQADAAAVAVTAWALPNEAVAEDLEITEAEVAEYRALMRTRSIWGFIAVVLGIAMLAVPVPVGEARDLKAAALLSWDSVYSMIESYSAALEQYASVDQGSNWSMFAIGTIVSNLVYLGIGLLLIVAGLFGAFAAKRLPRWVLVASPVVYLATLIFAFSAYYRLMEFIYTQMQMGEMLPISELYAIVFGVKDPGQNWGSLLTNLVFPLATVLVGIFGGGKGRDFSEPIDFDDVDDVVEPEEAAAVNLEKGDEQA